MSRGRNDCKIRHLIGSRNHVVPEAKGRQRRRKSKNQKQTADLTVLSDCPSLMFENDVLSESSFVQDLIVLPNVDDVYGDRLGLLVLFSASILKAARSFVRSDGSAKEVAEERSTRSTDNKHERQPARQLGMRREDRFLKDNHDVIVLPHAGKWTTW